MELYALINKLIYRSGPSFRVVFCCMPYSDPPTRFSPHEEGNIYICIYFQQPSPCSGGLITMTLHDTIIDKQPRQLQS